MAAIDADPVEFGILGSLEIRVRGTPIAIRQGLTRSLLLALLLRPNQTVSTDLLIEDLYGDELPANPLNALQVQVSYLRRALADAGVGEVLHTEGAGYRLAVGREVIDAGQFEALLERARRLAEERTAAALQDADDCVAQALALWRGTALEDVTYRDFAAAEITRLDELRVGARELRAELRLDLGQHREIAAELAALAKEHPLRERPRELLMLALYRAGRQADALRAHESARRALAEELGLDPGPELRRLERAILDQDPSLDWVPLTPGGRPASGGPAPTAAVTAPLPAPIARLIGRIDDLVEIGALLERSRAVTLTGPGGAGKTRLAIEYALRSSATSWFVDLGPVSDGSSVINEIAGAFGITIRSTDGWLPGVAALSPDGLLLLDTCEHVVDAAAEAVAGLLHRCPKLQVLATSRRPLEVAGELVWPVAPLAVPDSDAALDEMAGSPAVQLFLERASGARGNFQLTADNATAVAAVCRAVDGLPLGIELAAARLDVLSPEDLHRRLGDRFALLNAGSRGAVLRQRTLRAAVDWSYELLTVEERQLFHRLAVLPGPFSVDLAVAIIDGVVVEDPVDLLRSLARQSIVTRQGDDQFVILDTLQAYAQERSDSAETAKALAALTAWSAHVAKEGDRAIRSAQQRGAMSDLRRDLPNLRAALQWSLAEGGDPPAGAAIAGRLGWFWHLTGMYQEGHRWSVQATQVVDLSPAVRVAARIGAGLHATALGLLPEAREHLDDAVTTAKGLPLSGFEPRAWAHRGDMEWWFDDPAAAEADLAAAAGATGPQSTAPQPWVAAFAQLHLGRVRLRQARYDDAVALFDAAHPVVEEVGDAYLAELELRFRARGATLVGDPAAAVELASRALEHAEALGHTEGIAICLLAIGEAQRELGKRHEAEAFLRRAAEFSVAADHLGSVCQALSLLAAVEADAGFHDRARDLLARLLSAQASAGLPLLTPGGVVQQLVEDLLEGHYPKAGDRPNVTPAQGRAALRALALAHLR